MVNLRRILFLFLAVALVVSSVPAQQTTGTVKGVMTDDSGAVIPAASVSLVGGNGVTKTAQTQADGSYTFVGVAPGDYTVKVAFPGFSPFEKTVTVGAATVQVYPDVSSHLPQHLDEPGPGWVHADIA